MRGEEASFSSPLTRTGSFDALLPGGGQSSTYESDSQAGGSSSNAGHYYNPENPGFGRSYVRPGGPNSYQTSRSSPIPGLSNNLHLRSNSAAFSRQKNLSPYQVDPSPANWEKVGDGKREPDDFLWEYGDSSERGSWTKGGGSRACLNIGTLLLLGLAIVALFLGYPVITFFTRHITPIKSGNSNLGGVNASGQVAFIEGLPTLIDPQTPDDVKTRTGYDGKPYQLVFSDEFNTDGRSFYPGDDPYWEAVDLWYWGTDNYEWYDPAAVTTKDGSLQISLTERSTHNLNFQGGMLQSWNKFCFTGGYLEASIRLPGYSDVSGLWPAFWMMGNLGRAGYGASLEGTWPYSYEECDTGTLWNQTTSDGQPAANLKGGRTAFNGKYNTESLSWLQGQRLSACTCPNEDHPGPKLSDGSLKGRSAPEIDVFEGQVGNSFADRSMKTMQVSQSLQSAPFNHLYTFSNTSQAIEIYDNDISSLNSYKGAAFQQATSVVSDSLRSATQNGVRNRAGTGGDFAIYGTEFTPGKGGEAVWVNNNKPAWKLTSAALVADTNSGIGPRTVAAEPMYIIFNVGISQSFGTPDFRHLKFPATMSVDWVRVYQPTDAINVGCDPPDYPTFDYINKHSEAYSNAQLQNWGGTTSTGGYGQPWPKNKLNGCGDSVEYSYGGVEDPAHPHLRSKYISQADLPGY